MGNRHVNDALSGIGFLQRYGILQVNAMVNTSKNLVMRSAASESLIEA